MINVFASAGFGLIGLFIFLSFFMVLLIWLFRPGMKDRLKKYSNIPLEDDSI